METNYNEVPFRLHVERLFRETPAVHFSDINIEGSNGLDLVTHYGPAVSPPDHESGEKQFYMHYHQTDNNRVLSGARLFELVCFDWDLPHWYVYLTPETGALEIPPKCFHRSYSCKSGSILINQAIRDEHYDETKEFHPARPCLDKCPAPVFYNITGAEAAHFIQTGRIQ